MLKLSQEKIVKLNIILIFTEIITHALVNCNSKLGWSARDKQGFRTEKLATVGTRETQVAKILTLTTQIHEQGKTLDTISYKY